MKEIITIQHTQSIHHTNGMVGAWTDWDLSELGRKQADNIGKKLNKEINGNEFILYSSDLKRAKQTAEEVAKYLDITPILRQELREINEGEATGKSREWYNENKAPSISGGYYSDYKAFPSSESYRELWLRIKPFMDEIINSDHNKIILVSHGITMHLFFAMWIGIEFDDLTKFGCWAMSGGVSKLNIGANGKREIQVLNNMLYMHC
ncbi:MAG: phosphoglycerate mutase family protein [Anaerocolumna sp.]|jgi:probable phosphoglycerate mutase|nr:phosphoglycerate mutase family protein [Anaerocolumna sp.]